MILGEKLSSGVKNANSLIFEGSCYYYGFTCVTGKNTFMVTIYDNTEGSGNAIENYKTDASKEMDGHSHVIPVICRKGIYLSLGGGSAIVYYSPTKEY